MKKFLLVGTAVVFAGIAASVAFAADHKSPKHSAAPVRTTEVAPAKAIPHKTVARHHAIVKKHHRPAPKAHHAK